MAMSMKNVDPAFQGVGQKVGMDIWHIQSSHPVPVPKSEYGKFYSGDSYIVLQASATKSGTYHYDIHFWIGSYTSKDEAGTASIKAIELDAALGGRAVQYKELHGHETDRFLSYFKPCFMPLEGCMGSEDKKLERVNYETSLYLCKGKRVVRVKQVPFARSSLNHDDVFVLDTKSKIYQFNGATSNIQERAKALDVVQYIKDKFHEGKCDVAVIDDGKLVAEVDSGEFWALFGGFAPIGKKSSGEDDLQHESTPGKLYSIVDGQPKSIEGSLSKGMLESNKCYLLDCGSEIYVWVGRVTQLEDRKTASFAAEEFVSSEKTPKYTHLIRVIQGFETFTFRASFDLWPLANGTSGSEDGRGKVASLLKKQGVNVKGILKAPPAKDEIPPLLEEKGKLEVWRVNKNVKAPVPKEEFGKFYCKDCYVILYTYHPGDRKEDYFLCFWLGQQSTQEDKTTAARLTNTMANSLKGRPVQGRIVQGKEPAQFIGLFSNMAILNGTMALSNAKDNVQNGLPDETNNGDCVILLQVCSTEPHKSKAVQVEPVAASLDSTCCFLLQTGPSLFVWQGNSTAIEQQVVAARIAEFLKPGISLKAVKEGTEPAAFWNALGGRQTYVSQRGAQEIGRDVHLYACILENGILKVMEIFNFTQDDLLTEDVMILDASSEVFVWVGQHVDAKMKQQAFEIGQKYMERAALLEGLSLDAPLYRVSEGNEPTFFTRFFRWDSAKSMVQGNSFEKKLAFLQGVTVQAVEKLKNQVYKGDFGSTEISKQVSENSNGLKRGLSTQRAAALAALSSAFSLSNGNKGAPHASKAASTPTLNQASQRAAAVAELSTALSVEPKSFLPLNPRAPAALVADKEISVTGSETAEVETSITVRTESKPLLKEEESAAANDTEVKEVLTTEDATEVKEESVPESNRENEAKQEENGFSGTYSYERLKSKSTNPVPGIDPRRRESYLASDEFQKILKMDQKKFYEQPKWKQVRQKKAVDLF